MPAPRRRRWVMICLALSLGVNVLLGAWAVEARIMRGLDGEPPSAEAAIDRMASRLPGDDARILRDAFARVRPDLHRLIEQQRDAHERIKAALTAAPFDAAAFERQLAVSREQHHAIATLMADTLRTALEAMSADGRAAFARNYPGGRQG